jgi:hypothetical protein
MVAMRRRSIISIGLLYLAIAGCANKPQQPMVAIEDFCSDPRIMVEMQRQDPKLEPMGQPWCEASKVAFRRDDKVTEIPVAQVLRGTSRSYDVVLIVSDSIVRLPEDRLVNLGPNSPLPIQDNGRLERHLRRVFGMDVNRPPTPQFDRFYSAFLELTKRGYCVTYDMKPPFTGQLSECIGIPGFIGEVSLMPGATTWQ